MIIWSLEKGGAERFLVSLLKHIDRNQIEPTVCCLNWEGEWAKELEDKGIKVIALNKKSGFDLQTLIKLIKLIKKEKFDIVNTHLWGADVTGRLAAIITNTPIIISTAQNVDIWKKWWHRIIDRILSYKTDMIIAVSEAVRDYYHREVGIPLKKITIIPNAVEIEKYDNVGDVSYLYDELGLTSNDFILSCIGRLTEQKGQRYLLESIAQLQPESSNLKVLFVGSGEDENKLKEMAKKADIDRTVRFLGYRQDIPQILHLSKGLVLPSLYEGLPVCVLEAMAAERPVIVTKIGGIEGLVRDNETGFIVIPRNAEALTIAIRKLINLGDRDKKMGMGGKDIVINNYSIQSIARKTADLYTLLTKIIP